MTKECSELSSYVDNSSSFECFEDCIDEQTTESLPNSTEAQENNVLKKKYPFRMPIPYGNKLDNNATSLKYENTKQKGKNNMSTKAVENKEMSTSPSSSSSSCTSKENTDDIKDMGLNTTKNSIANNMASKDERKGIYRASILKNKIVNNFFLFAFVIFHNFPSGVHTGAPTGLFFLYEYIAQKILHGVETYKYHYVNLKARVNSSINIIFKEAASSFNQKVSENNT